MPLVRNDDVAVSLGCWVRLRRGMLPPVQLMRLLRVIPFPAPQSSPGGFLTLPAEML